jgi:hypothetical protein
MQVKSARPKGGRYGSNGEEQRRKATAKSNGEKQRRKATATTMQGRGRLAEWKARRQLAM